MRLETRIRGDEIFISDSKMDITPSKKLSLRYRLTPDKTTSILVNHRESPILSSAGCDYLYLCVCVCVYIK